MVVNYARLSETEEQKCHHNVAITAVFDSIYRRLYFIAKTSQAETKGAGALIYRSEEGKPCCKCLVPK